MSKIIIKPDALSTYIGHQFAPSRWIEIGQARIDAFADCTEDHQYIHVDPEQASKTPLGGTIAHGFLVLALLAPLCVESSVVPENMTMGFNYGFDRIRFLAPVRAGKRVRAKVEIRNIEVSAPGQLRVTHGVSVEIENQTKPALVADWLIAWLFAQ